MRRPTWVVLGLVIGCAHTTTSESSGKLVFSIQNLICLDCGKELEETAAKQPGVKAAHFDEQKLELNVEASPGTQPQTIAAALEAQEIDGRHISAIVGPGQGRFAPFQPLDANWDAKLLSQNGEDVADFQPAAGKVTIVDFFAEWCGPCHELDDVMHQLLSADRQLAYRRLNVVNWDSPLAKHYLQNAKELPFVIVLDTHGGEVARLTGFDVAGLKAAIEKGKQR